MSEYFLTPFAFYRLKQLEKLKIQEHALKRLLGLEKGEIQKAPKKPQKENKSDTNKTDEKTKK